MGGIWNKLGAQLVDTHCHVHHYTNLQAVTDDITTSGMKVHCVTVKPAEYSRCCKLFKDHSRIIPSPGFFPLYVKDEIHELDSFLTSLRQAEFIGEIGLDYSVMEKDELDLQREVFKTILEHCQCAGRKVLSLHSRRSAEDVLKFIGDSFNGTAIMHWFSGDPHLVKKSPENVFYSVNTAMLKSRQGKKVIQALRLDQVLTETDGPYININKQPAMPSDIRHVVNALSARWGIDIKKCVDILSENYRRAVEFI